MWLCFFWRVMPYSVHSAEYFVWMDNNGRDSLMSLSLRQSLIDRQGPQQWDKWHMRPRWNFRLTWRLGSGDWARVQSLGAKDTNHSATTLGQRYDVWWFLMSVWFPLPLIMVVSLETCFALMSVLRLKCCLIHLVQRQHWYIGGWGKLFRQCSITTASYVFLLICMVFLMVLYFSVIFFFLHSKNKSCYLNAKINTSWLHISNMFIV